MGLVDYSSDSDADADGKSLEKSSLSSGPPRKKKRLLSGAGAGVCDNGAPATPAPAKATISLPPAFHDLYASSVKTFDDPSLHQGRRRQTPHITGQWPSHVYIEWRPSGTTYASLSSFLSRLREQLPGKQSEWHSLLTSDLDVPQPLHISLSRPLSLPGATKDDFFKSVEVAIARSRVSPFELRVRGVEWHHTAESGRSFLVLRVCSVTKSDGSDSQPDLDGEVATAQRDSETGPSTSNPNPELKALLELCNAAAKAFDQPELYKWAERENDAGQVVGDAFHLSIGWSFVEPTEEIRMMTSTLFAEDDFGISRGTKVSIDSVKVKVGNVITSIPLPTTTSRVKPSLG